MTDSNQLRALGELTPEELQQLTQLMFRSDGEFRLEGVKSRPDGRKEVEVTVRNGRQKRTVVL